MADVNADSFRSAEVSNASNFHRFDARVRASITQTPASRQAYVMRQVVNSQVLHTKRW